VTEIYRCLLSCHDYLFYVSRELKVGVTEHVIGNTALHYAINTHMPSVQRTTSTDKWHYPEDRKIFTIYATPAELLPHPLCLIGDSRVSPDVNTSPVKISFNAVDDTLVFKMKEEKIAIPKVGAYMKYPALTGFEFFAIGGRGPPVIRIGKKLIPARIFYRRLENVEPADGEFSPSHAVAVQDLPSETRISAGSIIFLPNSAILTGGTLDGEHYKCKDGDGLYYIAKPDTRIFSSVSLS